jgi:DNA helicase-2/ATP-dependent DNA helicase PcrA
MPRRGIGDAALHRIHALCAEQSIPMREAMTALLGRGAFAGSAANGIRDFLGIVQDYRKRFREPQASLSRTAKSLVDRIGYRNEIARTCKTAAHCEMRWGNVQAVFSAIEQYEEAAQAPTLLGFLDENALNTGEDRRSKEDRRAAAVTLMTIHSAKGLEFPFVFIAGCEEGLLPHGKSTSDSAIEEERRLFYVAITRAKRHVTFFEALSRERFGREAMTQSSRFLKEIPEELVHKRVYARREMVEERVAPPKPKPKTKRRRKKR